MRMLSGGCGTEDDTYGGDGGANEGWEECVGRCLTVVGGKAWLGEGRR